MQYIDRLFDPKNENTWFRTAFDSKEYEVLSLETDFSPRNDDIKIRQIIFDYSDKPWFMEFRWTVDAADLFLQKNTERKLEPVLLEWTNKLANHWSSHWLHYEQTSPAPGGLPYRIETLTNDTEQRWALHFKIMNRRSGAEGKLTIYCYGDNVETPTEREIHAWSPDAKRVLDLLPIGTAILNGAGEITYFNNALKFQEDDLIKKKLPLPWEMVFHPDWLKEAWDYYFYYNRSYYATPWLNPYDKHTGLKNGPYCISLSPSHDGALLQLIPLPVEQAEILKFMHEDRVTGALTRDAWLEQSTHIPEEEGWLVLIGLDSFKYLNDTFGHNKGDEYLRDIVQKLKTQYPESIIGRWSGDEFILWIAQNSRPDVQHVLHQPSNINGIDVIISACAGFAKIRSEDFILEHVQPVEWALQEAKKLGRGKIFHVEQLTSTHLKSKLFHLEHGILKGLENNEFFLLYQPLINLKTKKIIGAEALIRWKHPDFGLIGPQHFIPLAEETGHIIPITTWIFNTLSERVNTFINNDNNDFILSVNLSPVQFHDQTILCDVQNMIEKSKFPANKIMLEITEGILLQDTDSNKKTMSELQALGIEFAIDDFGSGYSSMGYLKNMKVQQLKIDRSYIEKIQDSHYQTLTKSMIQLAHNIGLTVVAEGIETIEQEKILMALGCDLAQGFLYAKPMPEHELKELLFTQPLIKSNT